MKQGQGPEKIQIPTNVFSIVKLNVISVMVNRKELRWQATAFLVASIEKNFIFLVWV